MSKSPIIGLIRCPMCGNESATVHEQQSGTKKGRRYYRCYESQGSATMRCGTIQSIGPSGQIFINQNMRPIGQQEQPAGPIGQQEQPAAPIGQQEQPAAPPPPDAEPGEYRPGLEPRQVKPAKGDAEPRGLRSVLFGDDWSGEDD